MKRVIFVSSLVVVIVMFVLIKVITTSQQVSSSVGPAEARRSQIQAFIDKGILIYNSSTKTLRVDRRRLKRASELSRLSVWVEQFNQSSDRCKYVRFLDELTNGGSPLVTSLDEFRSVNSSSHQNESEFFNDNRSPFRIESQNRDKIIYIEKPTRFERVVYSIKEDLERDVEVEGDEALSVQGVDSKGLPPNFPRDLPWSEELANHLPNSVFEGGQSFTIEDSIGQACMHAARNLGVSVQEKEILGLSESEGYLPGRIAICAINGRNGDVLGLGSWPYSKSFGSWDLLPNGVRVQPREWFLSNGSQTAIRRYTYDHNFAPYYTGSSIKPILALANCISDPRVALFGAKGASHTESTILGVKIVNSSQMGWKVIPRRGVVTFSDYLSISDNRFHVATSFLALSPSLKMSSRGKYSLGEVFLSGQRVEGINDPTECAPFDDSFYTGKGLRGSKVANTLAEVFDSQFVEKPHPSEYRVSSFWGGRMLEANSLTKSFSPSNGILDVSSILSPRDYVSAVLGGNGMKWSNLALAESYARIFTNRRVSVRILRPKIGDSYRDPRSLDIDLNYSNLVKRGLAGCVNNSTGTAFRDFSKRQGSRPSALASINSTIGATAYGKTGTLSVGDRSKELSRFVLVLEENEGEGLLVLSFFVEDSKLAGSAKSLAASFIVENREVLRKWFEEN